MKALLELVDKLLYLIDAHEELRDVSTIPARELSSLLETLAREAVVMASSIREDLDAREADITLAARREDLLQHALEAIARGHYDEAESRLEAAINEFPDHHEYYNHLGLIAWERDDMKHAELYYARAAELCLGQMGALDLGWSHGHNRGYLRALEGRALCLYRMQDYDRARDLFETLASTCVPEYQGCHYLAGEICHVQGDYLGAIERYLQAPNEPSVLYNLGLAHFQAHRLEEAAATFIRAFAANPHVCEALLDRPLISDPDASMRGYLGSPMYAEEFLDACHALWGNEVEDARAFMSRCYDDPMVRQTLAGEMARQIQHEQQEQLWYPPSNEELRSVQHLAQRVLERIMY